MGNNFQSETRISGFISKKDVIFGGLRMHLSSSAQKTFIKRYNAVLDDNNDDSFAKVAAWNAVHEKYGEDENGFCSSEKITA